MSASPGFDSRVDNAVMLREEPETIKVTRAAYHSGAGAWKTCDVIQNAGRRWLVVGTSMLPMCLTAFVGWSVSEYVRDPAFVPHLLRLVPPLCYSIALLKVCVAVRAVVAVRRRNLIASTTLVRMAGVWLLIAFGLFSLLIWLLPSSLAPMRYVALGVFLYMPLVRLLLDWQMGTTALHAVFAAGRAAKPSARAFVDYLARSIHSENE